MTLSELGIIESARKLDAIEKEFLKLSYESSHPSDKSEVVEFAKRLWLLGSEAFDIRNNIAASYSDTMNIQVYKYETEVRKILNKIRENETFYSIGFYEMYSKELEDKLNRELDFPINFDQFIEAKYDDWYDEFYQRFHLTSYYKQIIAIGPIVTSSSIPKEALVYFNEIREAYALDLEYSAIALSRSVMEMCLFEKLQKKGYFKESKVIDLRIEREDKLHHLIRIARKEKLLDDRTRELAEEIRIKANDILHPKKSITQTKSDKRNVMFIISSVIKVLEKLYS